MPQPEVGGSTFSVTADIVIEYPLTVHLKVTPADGAAAMIWTGSWQALRRFVAVHLTSYADIAEIEDELQNGRPARFLIEVSQEHLSTQGFLGSKPLRSQPNV